ncbi:hypothetical protein ELI24_30825 (plasmid) [Rhizobium ruizarguesonis]|uniref:NADPH-dependent F420 reductase n=1 Tax=Rhizobium ruizarguesonis TaxID=2081791 RepID=UPI00103278A7|nr:NAD(P)-binding domain-containing protein [Rhizobium ruizarguesonis]TAV86958.1 hypothetical protein ELI24_30825 [Rhizobium ruizarguesonis]TAX62937.1 hypothetical protein ELI00_38560 [Rhizobium ruizarguesonis]
MNIGTNGAGHIGGSLTRLLTVVGHKVFVANSRGPGTLADLANQTGAKAVTAYEPARSGIPESRWVETQLNRPVLKAFNTINWKNLLNNGKPAGITGRIALPISGDDASAKARLIIDDLGFDAVVYTPSNLT